MSQFYRELAAGVAPAPALRAAVRWLRALTWEELRAVEQAHPALRVIDHATTSPPGPERPFRAPLAWASFIFSGA